MNWHIIVVQEKVCAAEQGQPTGESIQEGANAGKNNRGFA